MSSLDPSQAVQMIKCQKPECQKEFEVIMPMPEVLNGQFSSMLMMTHLEPEQCPKCGTMYRFRLTAIGGFNFEYVPVAPIEKPRIITPSKFVQ